MLEGRSAERRAAIAGWIEDLASDRGTRRKQAREALVALGRPAIGSLMKAMESPDWETRWGATKALAQMHVSERPVIDAFVARLDDERSGVRWLAASALIDSGRRGLEAVLRALIERAGSFRFRDSAHHVIHDLVETEAGWHDALTPVLAALDQTDAAVTVPEAARLALRTLTFRTQ